MVHKSFFSVCVQCQMLQRLQLVLRIQCSNRSVTICLVALKQTHVSMSCLGSMPDEYIHQFNAEFAFYSCLLYDTFLFPSCSSHLMTSDTVLGSC